MQCKGRGESVVMVVLLAGVLGKIYCFPGSAFLVHTDSDMRSDDGVPDIVSVDFSVPGYREYTEALEAKYPETEIRVRAEECIRYEEKNMAMDPVFYTDYEGMGGISIYTGTDTLIEFEVTVEEEGFYNLEMEYYPLEGNGNSIERRILVDGQLPYRELGRVKYGRIWRMGPEAAGGIREEDGSEDGGNSGMTEVKEWMISKSYDGTGVIADPLAVYLTAGEHTIAFCSVREPMLIHQILLKNEKPVQEYAQVKAFWDAVGIKETSGQEVRIEAEYVAGMSSQMFYTVQSRTSSAGCRFCGNRQADGCTGGLVWGETGQWAEWEFDIEESGYYHIALYDCQNYVKDAGACRRIMVDGTVPFAEMEDYWFAYGQRWREDMLSDDTGMPYVFYLKQGHHRIRMEAVLGDLSDIVNDVREEVWQLNEIYCYIKDASWTDLESFEGGKPAGITPELQADIANVRGKIDETAGELQALPGRYSDGVKVLTEMKNELDGLAGDVGSMDWNMSRFKDCMYACGNWADKFICQPLAIDCIHIVSADVENVHGKPSVFDWIDRTGFSTFAWPVQ